MDEYPHLHDEELAMRSDSIETQEVGGGCNLKQHQNYDCGCHGRLQRSIQ